MRLLHIAPLVGDDHQLECDGIWLASFAVVVRCAPRLKAAIAAAAPADALLACSTQATPSASAPTSFFLFSLSWCAAQQVLHTFLAID